MSSLKISNLKLFQFAQLPSMKSHFDRSLHNAIVTSSLRRLPWVHGAIGVAIVRGATIQIVPISVHALAKHSTQPIPDERCCNIQTHVLYIFRYTSITKELQFFSLPATHSRLPFAEHCIIINAWQAKNIPNRIKIFISSLTGQELDAVIYAIKHVCHNLIKIVFTSTRSLTHTHTPGAKDAIDSEQKKLRALLFFVNAHAENAIKILFALFHLFSLLKYISQLFALISYCKTLLHFTYFARVHQKVINLCDERPF